MSNETDEMVIELPPALVDLVNKLRSDQRDLLKNKAYGNPDQIRKFISMTLMERFIQTVEMVGTTLLDLHQISGSNSLQLQRQRRWVAKHLRKLGVEVSDGEALPGVGDEQINACGETFYALGSYLQSKYSDDKELGEKFNAFAQSYNALIEALMGDQRVEDDEDEEEGEEDDEEEVEGKADEGKADDAGGGAGDDA